MFEGAAGLPVFIILAIVAGAVLSTFGSKVLDLVIDWRKEKRKKNYIGENDRRRNSNPGTGNPGHNNSNIAMAIGANGAQLEQIIEKLSVFHRDAYAARDKVVEAFQEVGEKIGTEIQEGHERLRESIKANTVEVTKNTASVDVMKVKVERL